MNSVEFQDSSDIEAALEKLEPKIETDTEWFKRTVYKIGDKTFSFRGREELPIYKTVNDSRTTLLGADPCKVSKDDYGVYKSQIFATHDDTKKHEHYIATKTLSGVIELAIKLGCEDPDLLAINDELKRGVYGQKALDYIDALLALNFIDDSGNWQKDILDSKAEAVMVLALLGDHDAKNIVNKRVEMLRRIDSVKPVEVAISESDVEPFDPAELAVVHATRFMPSQMSDGGFSIHSAFDGSRGGSLRSTIHTTLNHKVTAHGGGSWHDTGYILISPFETMIRANGLPTVLNPIDTFWTQNPGEPLVFGDSILVEPGGAGMTSLFEIDGNRIKYKLDGFTVGDFKELIGYKNFGLLNMRFAEALSEPNDVLGRIRNGFEGLFDRDEFNRRRNSYKNSHLQDSENDLENNVFVRVFTEMSSKSTIRDAVLKYFQDSKIDEIIVSDNKDEVVAKIVDIATQAVMDQICGLLTSLATETAVNRLGMTVQQGGADSWTDSRKDKRVGALAAKLGVLSTMHSGTNENSLEDLAGMFLDRATERSKFIWGEYDPNFGSLILDLSPKSRRILYESGRLVSRCSD